MRGGPRQTLPSLHPDGVAAGGYAGSDPGRADGRGQAPAARLHTSRRGTGSGPSRSVTHFAPWHGVRPQPLRYTLRLGVTAFAPPRPVCDLRSPPSRGGKSSHLGRSRSLRCRSMRRRVRMRVSDIRQVDCTGMAGHRRHGSQGPNSPPGIGSPISGCAARSPRSHGALRCTQRPDQRRDERRPHARGSTRRFTRRRVRSAARWGPGRSVSSKTESQASRSAEAVIRH
jgi:hypothetical protein